jgi:[protein-PII] uridylyltransferase
LLGRWLELAPAYATRTNVVEAEKDVTVQTSLLESRLITGSRNLYAQFHLQFFEAMDPRAFFVAKTLEMHQRHSKFEDTPYSLEPNCKESPGGLRDLQVILWVTKAAGFGSDWNALAKAGLATPFEIKQIKHNEAMLHLIRARLHLLSQREPGWCLICRRPLQNRLAIWRQMSALTSVPLCAPVKP